MTTYFATFPAGCYDIIVKHLKSFDINQLKIIDHDSSSITFKSSLTIEKLIELRYLTNVYLVFDDSPKPRLRSLFNGHFFRLMRLKSGAPQPLDTSERAKLETNINRDFGLLPNTHLARNDFYVIERDSLPAFLSLRLPKAKFKREKTAAGELKPELAHILCLAAGLKAKYKVADPFAGHGAIPLEAIRGFGCKQVLAVDQNTILPDRRNHPEILWREADSRHLSFLEDNSLDRIVTDPPWGIYTEITDTATFYRGILNEFHRILKSGGVAVILTGWNEFNETLEQISGFKIIGQWDILVSGKKATLFKMQKKP
jgi:16S rRNA G966 N2-methylase RsmD